MKRLIFTLSLMFAVVSLQAEVVMPRIFGNGMVLEQQSDVRLWGRATPQSRVEIKRSWQRGKTIVKADNKGMWSATITTPAAGGPYEIEVSDGTVLRLSDVMIGQVWLCSGQSNMEMPMKGYKNQPVEGSTMDIMQSTNDAIRLFTVKHASTIEPQSDIEGSWQKAEPESVAKCSAVAYYFARRINAQLGVPVGIIVSSWGGSCIEAWMSRQMLTPFTNVAIPATQDDIKEKNRTPTTLYNGMIAPIAGYTIKGVLWYQGESNYDRPRSYADLFAAMIGGWRSKWAHSDTIPFHYVQIAPYDYSLITPKGQEVINSAFLREAQASLLGRVEGVSMAVTMDLGQRECIHPARKKEVGERLALQALVHDYGLKGLVGLSPRYKDMELRSDTVVVSFDGAPMWIAANGFVSNGFTLAGEDRRFYPARAWISRSKVYICAPEVKKPVAVRYCFENYIKGDITSTEWLPVSSFRSDNWEK